MNNLEVKNKYFLSPIQNYSFYEFNNIVIESYTVEDGGSTALNDMAIPSNIIFA